MDLQEVGCGVWTGSRWLRIGTGGGTYDRCNEPSGSIKRGDFLDLPKPVSLSRRIVLHGAWSLVLLQCVVFQVISSV